MFNPAEALRDNPALFACYVLFVYFRGKNAVRIEREMRGLGYSTFHRRNLYPRGKHPGWIEKHNWHRSFEQDVQDRQDVRTPNPNADHPVYPRHPVSISAESEKTDFHAWLKRVSPNMTWDWRHQQVIIEQLKKFTEGERQRLMIFLPPRHGKTELVSVRYTAWRMQQDPSMNVILGSYNQRLADRMSRKIRTVVCDAEAIRLGASSVPPAVAGGDPNVGPQINADKRRSDKTKVSESKDIGVHQRLSAVDPSETVSPFPFSRPRPKNAVSEWETASGGSFRAVGSGSGVTGFGANLIVIDDPVKNRAQAESETFRNRVWDWYKDDLYTRLEPDGSIVLIQTRWHEDDLAGRLLRENLDDWTIINLPALSEPPASAGGQLVTKDEPQMDADQRRYMSVPPAVAGGSPQPVAADTSETIAGSVHSVSSVVPSALTTDITEQTEATEQETQNNIGVDPRSSAVESLFEWRTAPNIALCPERFPVEALEKQRTQLGTYSFSALYQQRPTPAGGQIFKREWFKNIIDFAPPGLRWTRGYDLAVSTKTESDYTASFRVAFDDKSGTMYISGGFRRRIEFPEQRRYIIDRITHERDTQHGVELALHGQALLQDLRRDPALRGKSLRGVKVSTDKITRALTWSPLAEEGKVILIRSTASVPPAVAGRVPSSNALKRNSPPYEGGVDAALGGRGGSLSCETEISPRINRHPVHPVHPARNPSQPTHTDWISDLLDELAAFPNGTHDDQIDAISIAVQMHAIKPKRAGGMLVT